ncbi:hypothetical protein CEXT_805271, partial [Caerostris extrusa]
EYLFDERDALEDYKATGRPNLSKIPDYRILFHQRGIMQNIGKNLQQIATNIVSHCSMNDDNLVAF